MDGEVALVQQAVLHVLSDFQPRANRTRRANTTYLRECLASWHDHKGAWGEKYTRMSQS